MEHDGKAAKRGFRRRLPISACGDFPAPCAGCASRSAGCHSSCRRYAEFKAALAKANFEARAPYAAGGSL